MSSAADTSRPFWTALREDVAALADSPRELWLIYAIKFFESVAYFAVLNLIVVYLSKQLGYSDQKAGNIAGAWGMAVTGLTFFAGFVADSVGIRRAMLTSILSCLAGRLLLTVATNPALALTGLFIQTWGIASLLPTMTAGVRRYTRSETVSFGFSLFYVMMNVGAFVAPRSIGFFRKRIPGTVDLAFPGFGTVTWTSSQVIFAIGTVSTIICLLLTLLLREDAGVTTTRAVATPKRSPFDIMSEVTKERAFWGFIGIVSCLVLVKLVFSHAHQTWPKYTMREFGEDFGWADLWSWNPLMVMFLTPLVTAFTRQLSAFSCMVWGAFVTAGSVFIMAASTTVGASVAFVVVLSLGEMLWSPRLYEYTSTIAPKGREASYMGLSQVPLFFGKSLAGFLSGFLLTHLCPEQGPRSSQTMWLIIGVMTLVGPVTMLVLQRQLVKQKEPAPALVVE